MDNIMENNDILQQINERLTKIEHEIEKLKKKQKQNKRITMKITKSAPVKMKTTKSTPEKVNNENLSPKKQSQKLREALEELGDKEDLENDKNIREGRPESSQ